MEAYDIRTVPTTLGRGKVSGRECPPQREKKKHMLLVNSMKMVLFILICISISGCIAPLVGSMMPPSAKTDLGTTTPLLVEKEEIKKIRVIAVSDFPLNSSMMVGMGVPSDMNLMVFLTESIKNKGRFEVISMNQFRKKVMEMGETFDGTLTNDERYDTAQKIGKSLEADAVLILETGMRQGQSIGQSYASGFVTGRSTQNEKYKMYMISSQDKKVLWSQTLQYTLSHGSIFPKGEEVIKSVVLPLVENLHESFQ